jgi:predicted transcriptional regulator
VTSLPDHKPGEPCARIRMDARLDAATRQKVDDLAQHFHRPRAAVLCQIMRWGLSREQPIPLDQAKSPARMRHLSLYVPSKLHEHVQKAAVAAGVKTAPWLRHMIRQIGITDFPASWQEATPRERSHDSRILGTRFMQRLDGPTRDKLDDLSILFDQSAAEIVRQLIAQVEPEDFPPSWQIRAAERPARQARPRGRRPRGPR